MFKKTITSLNTDKASKLACAAAHNLESHLHQGSLLILQGLVSSSEAIAYGAATIAVYLYAQSLPVARKIKKRLKREWLQRRLTQDTILLAWKSFSENKTPMQILDLSLQALSLQVLKLLIGLCETTYRVVTWAIEHDWQASVRLAYQNPHFNKLCAVAKPSVYGLIFATAVISATSNADVADEMKVLIEQKKAGEAYVLGSKHPELMGDPLFDYFYGVAAVEVGHPTEGVLSLERVLLNDPNNDLVRLELARAYYAQGDYQRSKDEFLAVKKNQPPAGVVSTINVYLDDIKAKDASYKTTYGIFVELGMGYNNNVNAATAVNNIILPYIGPVTLGASSQPQKSAFGYDSIGANVSMPITSDVSVFANANTSAQRYSQANGYDLNVTNATTGVKVTDGPNTYKIAGFGSIAQIDQVPVPNTYGGGGEFVRQLTSTDSVMVAAGSTVLQYPSQFNAYNSNLNVGTVGYRKAFPDVKWQPVVDVSANMAHQIDTSNRPDLGRRIGGGALQLSFLPSEKVGVTIGAGYAQSKYDSNDLLYQTSRVDNLFSGNAVLQYKLTKELTARMEITYYNNLSNLNLYGYEQWTGAIKLRYDWNSN